MRDYFTSDWHLNHAQIIRYCKRPFLVGEDVDKSSDPKWRLTGESVRRMNDEIIAQANATVGADDRLWLMGDFAMLPRRREEARRLACEFRDRIVCKNINLVVGNHDDPTLIGDLFSEVHRQVEIMLQYQRIVLNHFPLLTWNNVHHRAWHLYGHEHGSLENYLDGHMPGRLSVDIGVDNAYRLLGAFRPFSIDDIRDMFKGRPGFSLHHK